jgi:hypothetical protein
VVVKDVSSDDGRGVAGAVVVADEVSVDPMNVRSPSKPTLDPLPGLASLCRTVPPSVPSVFHSSTAFTPSLAVYSMPSGPGVREARTSEAVK